MKKVIHPDYVETTISCACGNVVKTRATVPNMRVDICSKCHPFYTGKERMAERGGRVEQFNKRYGRGQAEAPTEEVEETAQA